MRALLEKWLLIFTGLFAIVWAIFRARSQAVIQDEGDTYFWFASKSAGHIWAAFPNNHVLNTLLIWITTRVFGLSPLTLRLPSLLGAVVYVTACYFLCRAITSRAVIQFPVFICLVYNPFLADFMVVARGYGLANGFLMAAIAIPVWHQVRGKPSLRASCACASLALGLSFSASFSFVFVDLGVFLALLLWARREGDPVWAYCVLPGLIPVLLLCAYPLTHWPANGTNTYTGHSLGEMMRSLVHGSLYQLAPWLRDSFLNDVKPLLLPALGIFCLGSLLATRSGGWLGKLAASLLAVVAASVLLHWIAFRFFNLPLPVTRTAIFFVPLCTLAAGAIAAIPGRTRLSQWFGQSIAVTFICLAGYFLSCLRFTYFGEYEEGADAKDIYAVLAHLNHTYRVNDVAVDGTYVAPLNFYRVMSNHETFQEFLYAPIADGSAIYVLQGKFYREFIASKKLAIVYHGKRTEFVVAVSPGSGMK